MLSLEMMEDRTLLSAVLGSESLRDAIWGANACVYGETSNFGIYGTSANPSAVEVEAVTVALTMDPVELVATPGLLVGESFDIEVHFTDVRDGIGPRAYASISRRKS